jgi:outer membrane protein assembly factor BamB
MSAHHVGRFEDFHQARGLTFLQSMIYRAGAGGSEIDHNRRRVMTRNDGVTCGVLVFYFAFMSSAFLHAFDWPRFRGPNGTGVSSDRGLPEEISLDKNLSWSVESPAGNSSPIVMDGRVFITCYEGNERIVLCYDAATGDRIWQESMTKLRTETFNPLNGPATPTPATDGRDVYVFFPEFGLAAFDREGKQLWKTPLGPFTAVQGLAASPVYVDGRIALFIDTPEEAYLSAYDARTGKEVWRAERPAGVLGSYATPTLYQRPGHPTQIVVAGAVELTGYDAGTGERLWWVNGLMAFPTAPPFISGDCVYTVEPVDSGWPPFSEPLGLFDKDKDGVIAIEEARDDTIWARSLIGVDRNLGNGDGVVTREEYAMTSREGRGGGLARTRVDGLGDVSNSHIVWRHIKGMPSLAGALLYQNVLYVVHNAIVSTFDPETGEMLRRERIRAALGDYYASPVAGDGKIYLASLEGKVTVLRAGADWEILSTADLGEQLIATPAIAGGRVYIRTEKKLYCFGSEEP